MRMWDHLMEAEGRVKQGSEGRLVPALITSAAETRFSGFLGWRARVAAD